MEVPPTISRRVQRLSPAHPNYTIRERLRVLLIGISKQLTNLSLMVFGLFAAGNCQLPRIAAKLPLLTGAASLPQRLRRLLMNEAIEPGRLYAPVAGFLLSCFTGGRVRLILDATDLGGRLPVLFVAVAYRRCRSGAALGGGDAAAHQGLFDVVVVTYMSRLARGSKYFIAEYLLEECGVKIERASQHYTDNMMGHMSKEMTIFLDGMYPKQVSQ